MFRYPKTNIAPPPPSIFDTSKQTWGGVVLSSYTLNKTYYLSAGSTKLMHGIPPPIFRYCKINVGGGQSYLPVRSTKLTIFLLAQENSSMVATPSPPYSDTPKQKKEEPSSLTQQKNRSGARPLSKPYPCLFMVSIKVTTP